MRLEPPLDNSGRCSNTYRAGAGRCSRSKDRSSSGTASRARYGTDDERFHDACQTTPTPTGIHQDGVGNVAVGVINGLDKRHAI